MTMRPDIAGQGTTTTVENADITVVGGGGHVGIPLVLALAEAGLRVNVNDINQMSLDTLASGRLPLSNPARKKCSPRRWPAIVSVFTNSSNRISTGGPVIVTIGTPIDEFLDPVRRVVQDCIDAMLPRSPTASFWCCARRCVSCTTTRRRPILRRRAQS